MDGMGMEFSASIGYGLRTDDTLFLSLFPFSLFELGHVLAFSLGLGNWPIQLLTYSVMPLWLAGWLASHLAFFKASGIWPTAWKLFVHLVVCIGDWMRGLSYQVFSLACGA